MLNRLIERVPTAFGVILVHVQRVILSDLTPNKSLKMKLPHYSCFPLPTSSISLMEVWTIQSQYFYSVRITGLNLQLTAVMWHKCHSAHLRGISCNFCSSPHWHVCPKHHSQDPPHTSSTAYGEVTSPSVTQWFTTALHKKRPLHHPQRLRPIVAHTYYTAALLAEDFCFECQVLLPWYELKRFWSRPCKISQSSTAPASTVTCWFELHLVFSAVHYASQEQLWC